MIHETRLLKRIGASILALVLSSLASVAYSASFDCAKASTFVENAICSDAELSTLDDTLSSVYRKASSASDAAGEIKSSQRSWIKKRNACQDNACLKKAYSQRIDALAAGDASAAPSTSNEDGANSAGRRSLPAQQEIKAEGPAEPIRVGSVNEASIASGCSCYISPVLANGKTDDGRCIFFDDFSGKVVMNLDGSEIALAEVGKNRVQDSSRPCFVRKRCEYNTSGLAADVIYRQNGDDYDVTITLVKGARKQTIKGKGACGC
jgi:uncharacterized protein